MEEATPALHTPKRKGRKGSLAATVPKPYPKIHKPRIVSLPVLPLAPPQKSYATKHRHRPSPPSPLSPVPDPVPALLNF